MRVLPEVVCCEIFDSAGLREQHKIPRAQLSPETLSERLKVLRGRKYEFHIDGRPIADFPQGPVLWIEVVYSDGNYTVEKGKQLGNRWIERAKTFGEFLAEEGDADGSWPVIDDVPCDMEDRIGDHPDGTKIQILKIPRVAVEGQSFDACRDSVGYIRRQFPGKRFICSCGSKVLLSSDYLLREQEIKWEEAVAPLSGSAEFTIRLPEGDTRSFYFDHEHMVSDLRGLLVDVVRRSDFGLKYGQSYLSDDEFLYDIGYDASKTIDVTEPPCGRNEVRVVVCQTGGSRTQLVLPVSEVDIDLPMLRDTAQEWGIGDAQFVFLGKRVSVDAGPGRLSDIGPLGKHTLYVGERPAAEATRKDVEIMALRNRFTIPIVPRVPVVAEVLKQVRVRDPQLAEAELSLVTIGDGECLLDDVIDADALRPGALKVLVVDRSSDPRAQRALADAFLVRPGERDHEDLFVRCGRNLSIFRNTLQRWKLLPK
jgi:hypothetical protein